MPKASAHRYFRTLAAMASLALAALTPRPLRADLDGRLAVLANALSASGAAAGHAVALTAVDGDGDPLGQALISGLRLALSGTAVALLPESATSSAQDLRLELASQPLDNGLAVKATLRSSQDPAPLWVRNIQIPAEDLPPGTLAGPGAEAPDAAFDVVPQAPDRPSGRRLRWDLSAAYKAFLPWNSTFRGVAGTRLDGISLGASFQDMVLLDVDAWHADLSGQGTLQSLDYAGVALALVAPWRLGPVTLYAGPGGRFGSIAVNDSSVPEGSVSFGNNAFEGVAGVKAAYQDLGLDLRYGYDFAASYTGYHTLRLGAYYAFGR
jgi:hypothetical protein